MTKTQVEVSVGGDGQKPRKKGWLRRHWSLARWCRFWRAKRGSMVQALHTA